MGFLMVWFGTEISTGSQYNEYSFTINTNYCNNPKALKITKN